MNKTIIIISGPSGTGKTTFAKFLTNKLNLPLFNKDSFKEILFNDLGWSDRDWSRKLGVASYSLMYYVVENLLPTGQSFILESNFKAEFETERFSNYQREYGYNIVQVNFVCDGKVLLDRFKKRSESGERHPGHVDHLNYAEFESNLLKGRFEPMPLGQKVVEVDTTDFNKVDNNKIAEEITG